MKREDGIINLGAISILLVSTIMMSVGVFVYNSKTSAIQRSNTVQNKYSYNYTNSTNSIFDDDETSFDDNSDYDLGDYSNYTNYSFGNFTEE